MDEVDALGRKKSGTGPFTGIPTSGLPDDLVPRSVAAVVLGRNGQTVVQQARKWEESGGKYGLRFYKVGLHRLYSMADLVKFAVDVYHVGRPEVYYKSIQFKSLSPENAAMARAAYKKAIEG